MVGYQLFEIIVDENRAPAIGRGLLCFDKHGVEITLQVTSGKSRARNERSFSASECIFLTMCFIVLAVGVAMNFVKD